MIYDVVIIGAGPAGLSAGLYAGRARLKTLVIEGAKEGGQIVQTAEIENYPGGLIEDSGQSLIDRMSSQAKKFNAELVKDIVLEVELLQSVKVIRCRNNTYRANTVILATGALATPIGCPGEKKFVGKGVSYCATCDAAFFEDYEVFVVGGGDSAVEEAIFLTRFARKVSIIHRRDSLRAAKSIQEKAMSNPKIEFIWDSVVTELDGDELLQSIHIENLKTGEKKEIRASEEDGIFGLFVFIGYQPNSKVFTDQVEMYNGYILTDDCMKTNIDGVFAAGDVRVKSLRQVVTAVSDGAIAAVQAGKYIEEHF